MILTLCPTRSDLTLILHRAGDRLTVNGQTFDFSALPEGGVLPSEEIGCPWILSDVRRAGGRLHLDLLLPHGPLPFPPPAAARAVTHPAPLVLEGDGPVPLPAYAAEDLTDDPVPAAP